MLVAHMCVSVHNVSLLWCADMDVSECVSLSSPCVSACLCVSVCMWVCWEGRGGGRGVDGLSGSPGPGGTALVNNSDEAHYQGSADFSLIPP